MIDPMTAGIVKRPSAELRHPSERENSPPHPPTPADDTPRGNHHQRAPSASALATLLAPEASNDDEASARHSERLVEPEASTCARVSRPAPAGAADWQDST